MCVETGCSCCWTFFFFFSYTNLPPWPKVARQLNHPLDDISISRCLSFASCFSYQFLQTNKMKEEENMKKKATTIAATRPTTTQCKQWKIYSCSIWHGSMWVCACVYRMGLDCLLLSRRIPFAVLSICGGTNWLSVYISLLESPVSITSKFIEFFFFSYYSSCVFVLDKRSEFRLLRFAINRNL